MEGYKFVDVIALNHLGSFTELIIPVLREIAKRDATGKYGNLYFKIDDFGETISFGEHPYYRGVRYLDLNNPDSYETILNLLWIYNALLCHKTIMLGTEPEFRRTSN